ncbi:30S ribosomal protein S3 [Candidatus Beckwithbacteria bacterium]|nr:30S ribosomal protein S3 [Candidatus Beckwithbacteria bacterium]
MGKKVNPFGFRLGVLNTWKSRWFANRHDYRKLLLEDIKLREYLMDKLKNAGIVKVEIERSINVIKIFIHVNRPGVVIGKGGTGMEDLKKEIKKRLNIRENDSKAMKVDVKVEEVKNANIQARLIAQRIADQLIGRYPHRRAVTQAIERAMESGAKGIKIQLSGRIGGAEIGRSEKYSEGTVPTQTLRADIDYAEVPSLTRSGYVGIKVWVYKGERKIN